MVKSYLYILCLLLAGASANIRVKRQITGEDVPLTDGQRLEIIRAHNRLRRSRGATDMKYMTWDSQLAWIAVEYGKTCQSGHNKKRNAHKTLKSVGENIWSSTGGVSSFNASSAIQAWYNEISFFNYNQLTCQSGKACGHYTQVVWANSYKIGCSLSKCENTASTTWRKSIKLICNYGPAGNVYFYGKMKTPYKTGAPCSSCANGDYCRDRLCANSSRDFIDEPETPVTTESGGTGGLVAAVVILTLVVVALGCYIFFKEKPEYLAKLKPVTT